MGDWHIATTDHRSSKTLNPQVVRPSVPSTTSRLRRAPPTAYARHRAPQFAPPPPLLTSLVVARCKSVTDIGIGCIAVGCSKLKTLNLKWYLGVSDLGVALIGV
ncbi:hypothetical protein R6Q59_014815 [Mikania micrantha]